MRYGLAAHPNQLFCIHGFSNALQPSGWKRKSPIRCNEFRSIRFSVTSTSNARFALADLIIFSLNDLLPFYTESILKI